MQMHRSRRTYEPGRPVTPWVFAIARHVYLMNRRSTGRRLRFEERAGRRGGSREDRPHDDAGRARRRRRRAPRAARRAGRSARGAADASRPGLELRRNRRAPRHPGQRREDARVSRDEEDAGAAEMSATARAPRDRDRRATCGRCGRCGRRSVRALVARAARGGDCRRGAGAALLPVRHRGASASCAPGAFRSARRSPAW